MKHKNEKTTIVQQSYNIRTAKKNNEKRKWYSPIKHNNEEQHWNTAMTQSNEKQQSYYNEKTMRHKNVNTIVQQSYNIRTAKKNNEKRKWNTPIKHNNEEQQWNTAMTHSNDK